MADSSLEAQLARKLKEQEEIAQKIDDIRERIEKRNEAKLADNKEKVCKVIMKYLGRTLNDLDAQNLENYLQGQEDRGDFFTLFMNDPKYNRLLTPDQYYKPKANKNKKRKAAREAAEKEAAEKKEAEKQAAEKKETDSIESADAVSDKSADSADSTASNNTDIPF